MRRRQMSIRNQLRIALMVFWAFAFVTTDVVSFELRMSAFMIGFCIVVYLALTDGPK